MCKKYTSNKDVNKYLRELEILGYTIAKTSKHVKVFNCNNELLTTVSASASDRRALLNVRSHFRKLTKLAV